MPAFDPDVRDVIFLPAGTQAPPRVGEVTQEGKVYAHECLECLSFDELLKRFE